MSPDTVRRDLRELNEAGLLRRVHGGALPAAVGDRPYAARLEQAPEAKAAIARATSRLFRHGQVILLDSGTTTLEVARNLPPELDPVIQLCSTSEVYGQVDPRHVPIDEDAPLRPASPYAVSKTAQDLLGWTYFVSYKLRIIRTRMLSLYGTYFCSQRCSPHE